MSNGKKMRAPCGHLGEVVIGTYVQCPRCDKKAIPVAIKPEKTEPMKVPRCPGCTSPDIEEFEEDIDAVMWYLQTHHIPTRHPMPPHRGEWACNSCGKVFQRPT